MEKVLIGELPKLSHSLRLSTKATISVFQDKTSSAVLSLTDMLTYSIKIKTGTTAQLPKRCIEKTMKAASSSQAAHICLNMQCLDLSTAMLQRCPTRLPCGRLNLVILQMVPRLWSTSSLFLVNQSGIYTMASLCCFLTAMTVRDPNIPVVVSSASSSFLTLMISQF